jgi:hypothetical protein
MGEGPPGPGGGVVVPIRHPVCPPQSMIVALTARVACVSAQVSRISRFDDFGETTVCALVSLMRATPSLFRTSPDSSVQLGPRMPRQETLTTIVAIRTRKERTVGILVPIRITKAHVAAKEAHRRVHRLPERLVWRRSISFRELPQPHARGSRRARSGGRRASARPECRVARRSGETAFGPWPVTRMPVNATMRPVGTTNVATLPFVPAVVRPARNATACYQGSGCRSPLKSRDRGWSRCRGICFRELSGGERDRHEVDRARCVSLHAPRWIHRVWSPAGSRSEWHSWHTGGGPRHCCRHRDRWDQTARLVSIGMAETRGAASGKRCSPAVGVAARESNAVSLQGGRARRDERERVSRRRDHTRLQADPRKSPSRDARVHDYRRKAIAPNRDGRAAAVPGATLHEMKRAQAARADVDNKPILDATP